MPGTTICGDGSIKKLAGVLELLPTGALREIAGDDDNIGFRSINRGDQGREDSAIQATEV